MLPRSNQGFSTEIIFSYAAIGLKHLRLMALLIALSLLLGLTYYTYARSVYHARSLVRVERLDRPMDRSVGASAVFIDSTDQALLREFTADHLIIRTAARLGVQATRAGLNRDHIKKLDVKFNSQGDIVVEIWPYSEAWANDWARVMVEEYLHYRDEKRQEQREQVVQSFTQELTQIRGKIDESLEQKHDLRDSSDTSRLLIDFEQLNDVPKQLLAVNRRLATMDRARQALTNPAYDTITRLAMFDFEDETSAPQASLSVGKIVADTTAPDGSAKTVVVPSMINPVGQPWQDLEREHRRLSGQLRLLQGTYGAGHPRMVALSKQRDEVSRALELELEAVVQRFNLHYAHLRDRRIELEGKLPQLREATRRHERSVQDLARADAGQLAWSSMQDQMTKFMSALSFWADKERVALQFMGHLEIKDFPVSPHRMKTALAALLLGLGLAVSMPLLLTYLDTTVTNPVELEQDLSIEPLGFVADWRNKPATSSTKIEDKERLDLHEQFRSIRTSLQLRANQSDQRRVLLIASALPGEGKTTIATNIARSFAQKGERTLLIDADLYRGSLHRSFKVSSQPGLSGLIQKRSSALNATVTIEPCLDLLPCGDRLRTGADLLDSRYFEAEMNALRARYDRVVIDSPPILGLPETLLLQRQADAVVLVVASELTPMQAVRDALTALRANKDNVEGFILNRVNFSSPQYRYRYYYYSNDYYAKYANAGAGSA